MKLTKEQKHRAIRKLARAYGKWNCVGGNRSKKQSALHRATWEVIKKFETTDLYRKSLEKELKETAK